MSTEFLGFQTGVLTAPDQEGFDFAGKFDGLWVTLVKQSSTNEVRGVFFSAEKPHDVEVHVSMRFLATVIGLPEEDSLVYFSVRHSSKTRTLVETQGGTFQRIVPN